MNASGEEGTQSHDIVKLPDFPIIPPDRITAQDMRNTVTLAMISQASVREPQNRWNLSIKAATSQCPFLFPIKQDGESEYHSPEMGEMSHHVGACDPEENSITPYPIIMYFAFMGTGMKNR